MTTHDSSEKYDLTRIIVGPLKLGLGLNVIGPGVMLFACHYINGHGGIENSVGDFANMLFYIFCAIGLGIMAVALLKARKKLAQPLVRRQETFEQDLIAGLNKISRPVFMLIATVAGLGPAYFLLTGRFQEAVFFVVASFIIFQIVRPRHGSVRKLIRIQETLVDQNRFRVE